MISNLSERPPRARPLPPPTARSSVLEILLQCSEPGDFLEHRLERIPGLQALSEGDVDKAVGLMQAQATSVSDFLVGIDPDAPETAPIRERLTEEAEQLDRLAKGAQERDRMLAMKSMAEDINLTSRGRDDKERRMRNRNKRDF